MFAFFYRSDPKAARVIGVPFKRELIRGPRSTLAHFLGGLRVELVEGAERRQAGDFHGRLAQSEGCRLAACPAVAGGVGGDGGVGWSM